MDTLVSKNNIIASEKVSQISSSVLGTLYLRKGKDAGNYQKLQNNQHIEMMEDLLDEGRISHKEFYEASNYIKVANRAKENYNCSNSENVQYDFDWFMRFFDAVGNISNKELQDLWAKVLAGEVRNPGNCSLRTLDMIRNMSPDEARRFQKICKYVVRSGDMYFVFPTGFFEKEYAECRNIIINNELNYVDDILPLFEAGAMTGDHDLAAYLEKDMPLQIVNDVIVSIIQNPSEEVVLIQQEAYQLTRSGIELYNIIYESETIEPDQEYFIECLRAFGKNNPAVNVLAFYVNKEDAECPLDPIKLFEE